MLTIHIIAMVSTTVAAIVKTFLLLGNKTNTFRKIRSATGPYVKILLIIGASIGIYIVITKFGGIIPPWLVVKLALFVAGGLTVIVAEKKENKLALLMGTLLLILVIVQANVKFNFGNGIDIL
jgi:hypothetical protein